MKLTLVGGGGSRTPVLYRGLVGRAAALGVDEVVLHDVDAAALRRVARILAGLDEEAGHGLHVTTTTDLPAALSGASFVLSAIRSGGFQARALDEEIALRHGVLGQETVGAGGFALALRNVPALVEVAETMRAHCPDAWLVNLTNPAGLVTQAVAPLLDGRVVGVCDSPIALARGVADALRVPLRRLGLRYGGLNHLGWLSEVWLDGRDVLPELLASPAATGIEEVRLFGAERLAPEGVIPNEYVWFYEQPQRAIDNIARGGESRGGFLLSEHRRLVASLESAATPREALAAYRRSLQTRNDTYLAVEAHLEREEGADAFDSAGGYHEMALSVVEALARDRPSVLVVNTANRGALPFLADDDVVEVPAVVRAAGVFPLAASVPAARMDLVARVKRYERETIAAIRARSRDAAEAALAVHPLVPSAATAAAVVADYLDALPSAAAALEPIG